MVTAEKTSLSTMNAIFHFTLCSKKFETTPHLNTTFEMSLGKMFCRFSTTRVLGCKKQHIHVKGDEKPYFHTSPIFIEEAIRRRIDGQETRGGRRGRFIFNISKLKKRKLNTLNQNIYII